MAKKLTKEQFIEICKRNNPELDCSDLDFINTRSMVYPKCQIHGKFEVKASSLLRGLTKGCPKCDQEHRKQEFIQKAKKIHGDKYDYSKIEYKTNKIPVEIVCPIHGSFFQAPGDHLKGYGCSKCSGKYKPTTEEWISKVKNLYNGKYNFSKVEYIDNKTPVTVICPIHGEFYPIPNNFIKEISGCPKCNNEAKHARYAKTTEQFIVDAKKVHGDKYDYSKVNYDTKNVKVCIICPKHGEFWQTPNGHLRGAGCPKCLNKNQYLLYEKLEAEFPEEEILYEFSTEWVSPQRFDIYFPNLNIAIEYDGEQHFKPIEKFGGTIKFEETKRLDILKNNKCIENNCKLFRVKFGYSEKDFNNLVLNIKEYLKDRDNYIPKLEQGGKLTII